MCRTNGSVILSNQDIVQLALSGIKDNHLYFIAISEDEGELIIEYLSPDTISTSYSYSYYAGYGKWVDQNVIIEGVGVYKYYLIDTTEIIYWSLFCKNNGTVYLLEFKNGSKSKSVVVGKGNMYEITIGNNCIFYYNKCYSFEGEYLYDISSTGLDKITNTNNSYSVFITQEEILYMSYTGTNAYFERVNLRTGEKVWGIYYATIHTLENPRTEFSITYKESNMWEFVCNAIDYDGTKIKISAVMDIDNPGATTVNEEEL